MSRTKYAEDFVSEFSSRPLIGEFVFLSPEFRKGKNTKEVCDLIFILRNQALLIQMKCQEDPASRAGDELRNWVVNKAEEGLKQIEGTSRRVLPSQ